jgi:ankyrin repeat protein
MAISALANVQNNRGQVPLYVNAANGATDMVRLLISVGGDVAKQDRKGRTALHLAAMNGHDRTVRELLTWDC